MRFRIVEGGNAIIGKGKLSKDGSSWDKDLDLNYKQVEQEERVHTFYVEAHFESTNL